MKQFFLAFLSITAFSLMFSSCKKPDPIIGCTDPLAENYNADAEENDASSCVYARDKFLNVYNGINECPAPLPEESTFELEITEGLSGENAVSIEFKNLDLPVPILNGTAEGDVITVPAAVYQVPLGIFPNNPDSLFDVTMSATAVYISEDSIKGQLDLIALSIPATCEFRAGKN